MSIRNSSIRNSKYNNLSGRHLGRIFGKSSQAAMARHVTVSLVLVSGMVLAVMATGGVPFQVGPGNRTTIATIVGGGLSVSAPVLTAPMIQPSAVALDPKGRGYYVVDERDGAGMLRFVNTTTATITMARATIEPSGINLLAGGGVGNESSPAREVDLGQVTGIAVDPGGEAVYLLTPLTNAIRVLNVGSENFSFLRRTIAPGRVLSVFNVGRTDARGLAVSSNRDLFYTATGPGGAGRAVYRVTTSNGDNGTESIFAGGGTVTSGNGDGGPAESSRIINPISVAVDSSDIVYIAESGDTRANPGRIRQVTPGGIITTYAQDLEFPIGVTVGPGNTIYAALGNSQQIVRLSSSGVKTTVAGNSMSLSCNQEAMPACGDGGPALSAFLNIPGSTQFRSITLAVDARGVFLPDDDFRRVRFINLSGGSVTIGGVEVRAGTINTIAGSGRMRPYDNVAAIYTELQRPTGMALDALGNLFISDTSATPFNLLRYVNRGNSPVKLFAGSAFEITVQPGQIVSLNNAVDSGKQDNRISTATFLSPAGLVTSSSGLFIVDSQYGALIRPPGSLSGRRSGHIRFLNTSGSPVTLFPNGGSRSIVVGPGEIRDVVGRNDSPGVDVIGDGGPASEAVIYPSDVALDSAGNLYIADQGNNLIRVVNQSTGIITSVRGGVGTEDTAPLETNAAAGIAIAGGRIFIADTRNDRVLRQDVAGGTRFSIIASASGGISKPRDVSVDSAGNVLVVSNGNHRIMRVVAPGNTLGSVSVIAGTGVAGYSGDGGRSTLAQLSLVTPGTALNEIQYTTNIAIQPDNQVIFADSNNNRIRMLSQEPNVAPQLAAIDNVTISEGVSTTISLSGRDANSDPLRFTLAGAPSFVKMLDNGNSTASVMISPGYSNSGNYTLSVTVSDGELSDTKSLTIIVNDTNRPPTVTATAVRSPQEATGPTGRQVILSGSGADPDGDTPGYQWFDGSVQIASTATATVTLGLGAHSIFLLVTDGRGLSASSSPQAISIVDTTAPVISSIPGNLTKGADDVKGVAVDYVMPTALDLVDGVLAVTADRASGSLFPIGATIVRFSAADSRGNSASASFTVTVTPPGGGAGDYTITTFAGTGASGFSGNGGLASAATFKQIVALGQDIDGNLLVADLLNRNFRRISLTTGVISTLAGNTVNGNAGDTGQAAFATFGQPGGIACDSKGNIFVSDTQYHRVRRIGADGKIYHFAGSNFGASGATGDNGLASAAKLYGPTALAVDAQDNLYIADSSNHRIRLVNGSTGVISTFAGTGGIGFSGDSGTASAATFNSPGGIAFDPAGNLFIADRNNHRIRRIDGASRIITTVAGTGNAAFSGDNGFAISAELNLPVDLTVDSAGNLILLDQNNHRVRIVSPAGIISTIAGDGTQGFGGDGALATLAKLSLPRAILALRDGSIYVGDSGNIRIRRIAPNSPLPSNRAPVITSAIGNQTLSMGQTLELSLTASDADGDNVTFSLLNGPGLATIINANPGQRTATLRLAPTEAGSFTGIQIRASDGKGGVATSVAFGITVNESAPLNRPPTVNVVTLPATLEAVAPAGAPIGLSGSGSDPDGDTLTFAWLDNGIQIAGQATANLNLAIGSHSLVLRVTDSKGAATSSTPQIVLVRDSTPPVINGIPANISVAGTSTSGATVNYVMPTALDLVDGVLAVTADRASGSLFPIGATIVRFSAADSRGNSASASFTVTVTPPGGGAGDYTITTFAGTGASGFSGNGGLASAATFKQIVALGQDIDGNLLVADLLNRNFRRISLTTGVISTLAGNTVNGNAGDTGQAAFATFGQPGGIACDSKGNIFVSDTQYHRVRRIGADGKIYHFAGSNFGASGATGDNGLASAAKLYGPTALAVDAQDNLYIADSSNHRIRLVNGSTGVISTFAGTGGIGFSGDSGTASAATFNSPGGIAFDPAGNLFIADRNNHRIRRIDGASRIITTVAGTGNAAFSGDNGFAISAELNLPVDLTVDSAGNLILLDQNNNRVRIVSPAGIISTIAGDGTQGFGGDGALATPAKLNLPRAILALRDRSIYIGDSGNIRIRRLTANLPPPNRAPVATAKALASSIAASNTNGATIQLDGSQSSDPDGDSLTYSWRDNGVEIATTVTASVRLSIGTHAITLTVSDGKGGSNTTAAQSVTVVPPKIEVTITSINTTTGKRGMTINSIISGTGFAPGATITLSGGGVAVLSTVISPTQMSVRILVLSTAAPSVRSLTVTNRDGSWTTRSNAFTVIP